MRHLFQPRLFLPFAFGIAIFAIPKAFAAPSMPPTVDPTYGLPLRAAPNATPAPASAAQWVWAGRAQDNQTVFLRRAFDLTAAPKAAKLWITADDFFTLFVNGKQVDRSQADPKDNNIWQHVHQINAAPYLRAGKNVLAARVQNAGGAAGLIARLEMTGHAAIVTDTRWRASPQTVPAEDWVRPDFDESAWQAATVIAPLAGGVWADAGGLPGWPGYEAAAAPYLAHLTLPFAAVLERHPGAGKITGADSLAGHTAVTEVTITPPPPGATDPPSLLLDFGKEIAGRVVVDPLDAGAVQIGTGESAEEAVKAPWGGVHTLRLAPGTRAATPYSAFRYARLAFPPPAAGAAPGPVRLRVAVDHKYYPVQYQGRFACSDPQLTKIWYTGAYTSHLCMQEDIWDAPKRDRARWIGDLHVSGEVINNVFADKLLMERTLTRLRDAAQGGRPDAALPVTHVNDIPGYSCAWICCLADFHRHLGDRAFLKRQHDRLLSLLEYMRGDLDDRDLFANTHAKWPFVDWSPEFNGDHPPARAATHLFYVQAAREAAFLLREMGDAPNAAKYAAWADRLTLAARRYLPDAAAHTYGGRLQENAMAVYSGVATPEQRAAIYQAVLDPDSPAWNKAGALLGNQPVLSPYYGNYVLFAMSLAGHNAEALRVLRRFWGGMLAEGATTFWEAYDPRWPKQDFHAHLQADDNEGYFVSLCHGWSSGPTNWLTERVLGIRPTGGGFQTAEIAPDLGGLAWAEGDVPTPRGLLHVRVDRAGDKMTVTVIVPPGVSASVRLPGAAAAQRAAPGRHTFTGRIAMGRIAP